MRDSADNLWETLRLRRRKKATLLQPETHKGREKLLLRHPDTVDVSVAWISSVETGASLSTLSVPCGRLRLANDDSRRARRRFLKPPIESHERLASLGGRQMQSVGKIHSARCPAQRRFDTDGILELHR